MQNARNKLAKEKRNPLLDQVKHTGLTHFKPGPAIANRHGGKTRDDDRGGAYVDDDDDDDDDDISTISGRLKAISDRYLKSSTHRFLAKLYKNPSVKTGKPTGTERPDADKNAAVVAKVSAGCCYCLPLLVWTALGPMGHMSGSSPLCVDESVEM